MLAFLSDGIVDGDMRTRCPNGIRVVRFGLPDGVAPGGLVSVVRGPLPPPATLPTTLAACIHSLPPVPGLADRARRVATPVEPASRPSRRCPAERCCP